MKNTIRTKKDNKIFKKVTKSNGTLMECIINRFSDKISLNIILAGVIISVGIPALSIFSENFIIYLETSVIFLTGMFSIFILLSIIDFFKK